MSYLTVATGFFNTVISVAAAVWGLCEQRVGNVHMLNVTEQLRECQRQFYWWLTDRRESCFTLPSHRQELSVCPVELHIHYIQGIHINNTVQVNLIGARHLSIWMFQSI